MKKRRKKGFAGESNSSGLKIGFYEIVDSETVNLAEAESRNYNPDASARRIVSKKTKIIRFVFLFFLCSAVLTANQFLFLGELIVVAGDDFLLTQACFNFMLYFWLGLISLIIAMTVNHYLDSYKTAKQWHACEHKVGHLFEKKLKVNLENLKKMGRVHRCCGDSILIENLLSKSIIIFLFVAAYLVSVCFMGLGFLLGLALLGIVAVIWMIISGLIAYVFTTAKPIEEQLRETLQVAKEFKSKLDKLEKQNSQDVVAG